MAEQPRVHDSTGEISARSTRPLPPLSRYAGTDDAAQPVEPAETAADTQSETDAGARRFDRPGAEAAGAGPDSARTRSDAGPAAARPVSDSPPTPPRAVSNAPPPDKASAPEQVQRSPAARTDDATTRASKPSPGALVRVQAEPARDAGRREKVPFWKRIVLPRPIAAAVEGPSTRAQTLEPILARLNALERQVAANQSATEMHLDRFEENITRLWELEEQMTLTEVRERLALLEANQVEIADGLHTVSRNISILAIVLSIAVAAALLGVGLAL